MAKTAKAARRRAMSVQAAGAQRLSERRRKSRRYTADLGVTPDRYTGDFDTGCNPNPDPNPSPNPDPNPNPNTNPNPNPTPNPNRNPNQVQPPTVLKPHASRPVPRPR